MRSVIRARGILISPHKSILSSLIIFIVFLFIMFLLIDVNLNSNELDVKPKHKVRSIRSMSLTKEEVSSGDLRIEQDDPRLLQYIKRNHIVSPSTSGDVDWIPVDGPLASYGEQQQVARFVFNLLGNKTKGTFIECGANDGEFFSNTAFLERDFEWSGLLVESDPRPLKKLLQRHRKSWVSTSCLSTDNAPKKLEFLRHDKFEGLSFIPGKRQFIGNEENYYGFEAQCFPLYSILKAIGLMEVDYFSLDIEGAELDVLKTIPWEKVFIKVLSIEVHPEYVMPVKEFMLSVGYKFVTFIQNSYSHDQIYVHPEVTFDENLIAPKINEILFKVK